MSGCFAAESVRRVLQEELRLLYASYERALNGWIAAYPRGVSCRKGCGACCNMSVGLYLPEAIVLADALTDAQYDGVAEYARRALAYAEKTDDYIGGFRHAGPGCCPFLDADTQACAMHPQRPANCRHVFSNMPPEFCQKDAAARFEQHPDDHAAYLRQLDPAVNDDGLPYIAPLNAIFHEQYELYLLLLTARHGNLIIQGEMAWLIMLVREHHLAAMAAQPDITAETLIARLHRAGRYHPHLLTACDPIPPHIREASAEIDFRALP